MEARALAQRSIRETPGYGQLERVAGIVALAWASIRALLRPPFTWRHDFIEECWLATTRCTVPLLVSCFAMGFGTLGMDAGGLLRTLGAPDRLGAISARAGIEAFAPFVSAVVVAGVVGTAVCADLGARRIRDELDAMAVLGVDPVRALVAPRFLALFTMTIVFGVIGIAAVEAAGLLVGTVFLDQPTTSFFLTFKAQTTPLQVPASIVKAAGYGLLIAAVFTHEGLHASGGSEGVGRAVNRAVVIVFMGIFIFLVAFDSVYQALFPSLQQVR